MLEPIYFKSIQHSNDNVDFDIIQELGVVISKRKDINQTFDSQAQPLTTGSRNSENHTVITVF